MVFFSCIVSIVVFVSIALLLVVLSWFFSFCVTVITTFWAIIVLRSWFCHGLFVLHCYCCYFFGHCLVPRSLFILYCCCYNSFGHHPTCCGLLMVFSSFELLLLHLFEPLPYFSWSFCGFSSCIVIIVAFLTITLFLVIFSWSFCFSLLAIALLLMVFSS